MVYDVIIIGGGPAGLTAALYAKRACLNHLLLQDKFSTVSQICNTYEVCNYIGLNNLSGPELYDRFLNHIKELDVNTVYEKVIELCDIDKKIKIVKTQKNVYETKTIIYGIGATPKDAGISREKEFEGLGVSYCATCDGDFYKGKEVAVVGGGDVAIEDAIFLSRICKKVYVIVRKNELRATKTLVEEAKKKDNIEFLYETIVDSILTKDDNKTFGGVLIRGVNAIIPSELNVDGLFVAIGMNPRTDLLKDKVKMENNYIVADETCKTSIDGVYAIGDVRTKQLRQVITACSDGANAITSVERYLIENTTNN